MTSTDPFISAQSVSVLPADTLRVVNGANLGDAIGIADEIMPGDVYRLTRAASERRLTLLPAPHHPFRIAEDSKLGTPGADLHLDCCVTFMSGAGETSEALVMVETDDEGCITDTFLLPLAAMEPHTDYALVGVSADSALQKFAQVACVSFTRGTQITMASGAQRRVEELRVGDRVLTRDDGPQPIRWIGQTTLRAVGAFAPIAIKAGTLHNARDLVVSPDHRLFIYQRNDRVETGRPELLVKARHLINGETVTRLSGGFVDYYQMMFDHHQIIYAEGIAAESMVVDTRTRAALPEEVNARLGALRPGDWNTAQRDIEVQEPLLRRPDAVEVLRKSSGG